MGAIENALQVARKSREGGGYLDIPHARKPKVTKLHVGPIHSAVAGRTDHLPMHVPHASYVLPAENVSNIGEGNTAAGFDTIRRVFSGTPYGGGAQTSPYGQNHGLYGQMSRGGEAKSVPIVAAGGEYVLSPQEVQWVGDGDLDFGHKVLDGFVNKMRERSIKTLKALPGPRAD